MRITHNYDWLVTGLLVVLAAATGMGQPASTADATDLAQRQVTAYLAKLADLHCTESVVQEKLSTSGHVEASEKAKYDYLIMMDGDDNDFQLNESRIESTASKHKALPMLVTNGFSTLLLVFHPYYRDSFTFAMEGEQQVNGRPAVGIKFAHIPGGRTPAALALRGREYPLDLEGTAWLDKETGEVVKIDASLLHDMSDVGLRSINVHVEYKAETLGGRSAKMTLPSLAVVDVTTPRQHWRNTHIFEGYKSFSTDAEQDPNVKIRASSAAMGHDNTASIETNSPKEKP